MKVILCTADLEGCGMYRMIMPANELADEHEIQLVDNIPLKGKGGTDPIEIIGVGDDLECDVIVFQRPLFYQICQAIPYIRAKGIAVVVEIDDDLTCIPHSNVNQPFYHPKTNILYNWHHLKKACNLADLVICSTPELAKNYSNRGHSVVLRNCVPEYYLDVEADRDGKTIGWGGIIYTHGDDIKMTYGGVTQVVEDFDANFKIVGDGVGIKNALGLMRDPIVTGSVPFADYIREVAKFDVGIVPLSDSKFNSSKSWLKGLEYASTGVPFVASPRPEYQALSDAGIGLLANDRGRTWKKLLSALMRDERYRTDLSIEYREKVRKNHLISTHAWRWAEAWEEAILLNRAPRRVRT